MRPAALRWRWMLGADTTRAWWCLRCQAMVWGPWSSPLLARSQRKPMIRSTVACGNRVGLVCGRRERGSNAASFESIAGEQLRDPPLRHPVLAGHLRLATTLNNDGSDDQAGVRHPLTLTPSTIPMS